MLISILDIVAIAVAFQYLLSGVNHRHVAIDKYFFE